jgi:hypothetical protein
MIIGTSGHRDIGTSGHRVIGSSGYRGNAMAGPDALGPKTRAAASCAR